MIAVKYLYLKTDAVMSYTCFLYFVLLTTGKIIVLAVSKMSCQQKHQHACADSLLFYSKCSEIQKSEGLKV